MLWTEEFVLDPGCVERPVTVPAGRSLRFYLRSADASGWTAAWTRIAPGDHLRVDLQSTARCSIELRLLGSDGPDSDRPLVVSISEVRDGGRHRIPLDRLTGVTDADGRFAFGARCGTEVFVAAEGAQIEGHWGRSKLVLTSEQWTLVTEPLWTVRLRVQDEDGSPVRGARFDPGAEEAEEIPPSGLLLDGWARSGLGGIEADGYALQHWSPSRSDHLELGADGIWDAIAVLSRDGDRRALSIELDRALAERGAVVAVVDAEGARSCVEDEARRWRCELGAATLAIVVAGEHDIARAWAPADVPAPVRPSEAVEGCLDLFALGCAADGPELVSLHPEPARPHSLLGPVDRAVGDTADPRPFCLRAPEGQSVVVTCGIDPPRRWRWRPPAAPESLDGSAE